MKIKTKNCKKAYRFIATTKEERDSWYNAISSQINLCK